MTRYTITASTATNGNTQAHPIRKLLLCVFALLPALLISGHAYAVDAPANIRVEQNTLLWDGVAGASKYNIYFFASSSTGANGDFITTVVDTNEFEPGMAGFYTVVTVTPDGEYSALNAGARVEFNFGDEPEPDPDTDKPISEIRTQQCENVVAGSTCTAQCAMSGDYLATGGACRADTGTVIHHRALQTDVYCRRP